MTTIERPMLAAVLGLGLALAACEHRDVTEGGEHAPAAEPAHTAPAVEPATLDARKPVPMTAMMAEHHKQEMRDHLQVIQEIVAGLGHDDFAAIEKAATRIGWNEREAAMCKHMGAGAPGFAEFGERFHHTADKIVDAARAKDRAGVVTALDATLQACTQCHAMFKQQVVSAPPPMTGDAAAASGDMPMDCPMMDKMGAGHGPHGPHGPHGAMHGLGPMGAGPGPKPDTK